MSFRLDTSAGIASVALSMSLSLFAATTAVAQPEVGGPPVHPISRVDPRVYETTLTADIFTEKRELTERDPLLADQSELVVPIIMQGAFSRTYPDSIVVAGQINGQFHEAGTVPWTLRGPHPDGTAEIVIEFADLRARTLGVRVTWREQSWLAVVDEAAAMQVTWPVEWPETVRPFLAPQPWIQSKAEIITNFVQRTTQGNLRRVTPYSAAKELTRQTIALFTSISGTGNERRNLGQITGLQLTGAEEAMELGRGSPNDLVCCCVAVLKAAGIPARPVVGVAKEFTKEMKQVTQWRVWGEFYLPGSGWIPFDPNMMRGSGIDNRSLDAAWRGFANVKELDERIPVAYRFQPKGSHWDEWPPVWGWFYGGNLQRVLRIYPQTSLMRISRGKGEPDP
ncbi:MAG: transglutaminase-like domain-containing protein [Phycisphaerales bacterium]|nr:transglutaminase-like domain-containing protein [Phycisphaerales bacterium]